MSQSHLAQSLLTLGKDKECGLGCLWVSIVSSQAFLFSLVSVDSQLPRIWDHLGDKPVFPSPMEACEAEVERPTLSMEVTAT